MTLDRMWKNFRHYAFALYSLCVSEL
jgi:hypothetical protein